MFHHQMFKVSTISDKDQWERLNASCRHKTFMQSWSSQEWRQSLGQKVDLIGVFKQQELIGGALVAEMPLIKKFNLNWKFLFIPHGPLISDRHECFKAEITSLIIDHLKGKARSNNHLVFLRISPAWPDNDQDRAFFKKKGLIKAPIFITPDVTWCRRIDVSDEELMRGMRKTTRYLVRKGLENKDLTVRIGNDLSDLDPFLQLYEKTVNRHNFQAFSRNYLEKELEILGSNNQAAVITAYYRKQLLASVIIVFYQGIGHYYQGASADRQPKEAPASYRLQWAAIQEAKKRGCHTYNFWGIAKKDDPSHAYYGLSLFKKGFGGERFDYCPGYDLAFRWPYYFNYFLEKQRRRKRKI